MEGLRVAGRGVVVMRLCLTRLYYSSTLTGSENVLIALREREVPTTFARRKVQEGIGYKL